MESEGRHSSINEGARRPWPRPDERALSIGASLFSFLLIAKLSLLIWNVLVKERRPLADVPADGVFLISGLDLLFSLAVAFACYVLYRLEAIGSAWRIFVARPARWLMIAGIVIFSCASFQVARIYGSPLDVELLRSGDDLVVLRESIWAYLGPLPAVLMAYGLIGVPILSGLLAPRLTRRRWLRNNLHLWVVLTIVCFSLAMLQWKRLYRIDTFGVKENFVLFFVKEYEPPFRPIDTPRVMNEVQAKLGDAVQRTQLPTSLTASGDTLARDFPFAPETATKARDMNVLVIQVESTSALHVNDETAPNLAALARDALSFKRHATTVTQTRPATYSLNYSDFLPELGTQPSLVYGRPMPQPALAEVLKQAGYRTGVFHTGFLDYVEIRYLFEDKGIDVAAGAREMLDEGAELAYSSGVYEERTVEELTQWIAQDKDHKFFATYITEFPHHPYVSMAENKPFPEDSWLGRYKNSLHYADSALAGLIDFLKREGLYEKTLIVVVGDHGETVSSYPVGHGLRVSVEEIRTPFMLCNPVLFPKPLESRLVTSHIDVAPTIVRLLGLEPPTVWLGRDLLAEQIPARMQFCAITHIRRTCLIDGDLIYVLERKSGKSHLYQMDDLDLIPIAESDPRRARMDDYKREVEWYTGWSVWRHLARAGATDGDKLARDPAAPVAPGEARPAGSDMTLAPVGQRRG